jgi:hypothetical protein
VKEINIRIWRNDKEQDWSIDVDGALHHHVSAKTIDDLVEYAIVAAQQSLIESKPAPAGEEDDRLPN